MILILGEENIANKIQDIRRRIQQDKKIYSGDSITLNQFNELYNEYGQEFEKKIFARYVLDISYGAFKTLNLNVSKITHVFTKDRINEENIKEIREKIIKEHNLHIGDEIGYNQLVKMYNSTEPICNLRTFALEVLEISNTVFMNLKINSNKKAKVLSRTKVSNSEILEIREKIKKEYNIKEKDKISVKQFEEIYQKYGGILKQTEFAQKVLEISRTNLGQQKRRGENSTITILSQNEILLSDSEIDLIREQISREYNLHIDDFLETECFKQIANQYKGKYTEKQLAEEILGVPLEYFNKGGSTRIFQKVKLSKDYIKSLRESIIENENLHSEDLITYKEFERLYKEYGSILSINQFAIYILDIPETNINNMKTSKVITILKNECLSLEEIEEITKKILKEYSLKIEDTIDYKQFREMYEKYGGRMSEKQFSEDVLDASYRAFFERFKRSVILSSTIIPEEYIENLRRRILKETNLKINQRINYDRFCEIYKQYGGILRQRYFAEEVLQMPKNRYYLIKENEEETTVIFTKETINAAEFEKLKSKILEENNLHVKDFIDYNKFQKIYNQYPTNLKEKDFANVILGMSEKDYNNIKYIKNARTRILKNEIITEEEIKQKREFFKQMEGKSINYEQFKKIHKQYGGKMDEFFFCEQILGFKLNFIKYYKANATIKDPIAKQKAIEIRKKFENETCKFFTKEEVDELCEEYGISQKDFLNYVVLKYNFQFYEETEESFQINNGIWFGGEKIPLTREFINEFSDRLVMISTGVTRNLAKTYRLSQHLQEDIIQELLIKAMEEHGELERNFSYNSEEVIKRIGVRMRSNALHIMCSHFNLQSKNVSARYYYKERVGPDIQLTDTENSVEKDAIENVTTEESEFTEKVIYAIRALARNGNSSNEIQHAMMNYLRNRKSKFD